MINRNWSSYMFKAHYDDTRFRFINKDLILSSLIEKVGGEKIKKTGCFYGKEFNFYIDTSDGVNEDLRISEYCGRILRVIEDCQGKRFLFFKAAHSPRWSCDIESLAEQNNGKVIPFFKWSFNDSFYRNVFGKREQLIVKLGEITKEYDIGYFCGLGSYSYPKPSSAEPLISWPDHKYFGIPGSSVDTGYYSNNSRKLLYLNPAIR